MKMRHVVLLLSLSLSLIAARYADAYPRDVKWREFQTDHFRVIFAEQHRQQAEALSRMVETIHQEMSRILNVDKKINTTIIVTDYLDDASLPNSVMLSQFGGNIVLQLGEMKTGWPSLGMDVKEWMMIQFIYQYTNVMRHHLDTFWRKLFSLGYVDNGFSGWMEGGMVVYMANQLLDKQSRLPAIDMILRTDATNGGLSSLKQKSVGGVPSYNGNPAIFAYGYSFLQYLADTYGAESLVKLIHAQRNNIPFPFFTKDAFVEAYGKSFKILEEEWSNYARVIYAQQITEIQAHPLTNSSSLTAAGYGIQRPALSPDGQFVYYVETTPDNSPALIRQRLSDGEKTRMTSGNIGETYSITADGRYLYFSKTDLYHAYYQRSDIYRLDLNNFHVTRLTKGERAFDPAVTPDGSAIVYVKQEGASSILMRWDAQSGQKTILAKTSDWALIRQLTFSSDGSKLAAQTLTRDGKQGFVIMQPDGTQIGTILYDMNQKGAPMWGVNDRYLFFHSALSGVPNIFAYDLTDNTLYQVTNVLTGAFEPCVSSNGQTLLFTQYSRKGFDIQQMPLGQVNWQATVPAQPNSGNTLTAAPTTIGKESRYKAYSTMLPATFPIWGSDEEGFQLGLEFAGSDALNRHKYSLSAMYGFESNRFDLEGEYINNQFFPSIGLFGYSKGRGYGDLFIDKNGKDEDYWELQQGGGIEIGFPLYRTNRTDAFLTAGYEYKEIEHLTALDKLSAPYPDEGALGNASSRFILRSYEEYQNSISPEKGALTSVRYRRYDEMFGSDFNISELVGDLNLFVPMPFKHHVLFLRGAGGISDGDTLQQGLFQLGGYMWNFETQVIYEPTFYLRGYKENVFKGDRFALATAEYRLPLWYANRAIFSGLFFLESFAGSVFWEAGDAWKDATEDAELESSAGGDLSARFVYKRLHLQGHAGVAHGFDEDKGETQVYFKMRFLFF
ncbi:WD40 domain protein beta Propeller [Candidatus Moduliflexus flocculans]|uniref:WD40 domain protein beta Propeller n=1 Tax=Candidatus Moduliflexus flocculans TaxID=1499966 RepID=A0A0S6W4F9_9BACT|nr:WD40 domain protein beta Propeller [Candidatus Moduliflexus flocculans]